MSAKTQARTMPAALVTETNEFSGMSLGQMARIAITRLERQSGKTQIPCGMVSGPISTGGLEATETSSSLHRNLLAFNMTIEEMRKQGHNVFSQMPYESRIVELYNIWHAEHGKDVYFKPVLEEFYKPIFESGYISDLWLIPSWRSSKGAVWEQNFCERKGIRTTQIEPELFHHWIRERGI